MDINFRDDFYLTLEIDSMVNQAVLHSDFSFFFCLLVTIWQ